MSKKLTEKGQRDLKLINRALESGDPQEERFRVIVSL